MHNNIDPTHHLFSLPDELFIENVYIYTLQREADGVGETDATIHRIEF